MSSSKNESAQVFKLNKLTETSFQMQANYLNNMEKASLKKIKNKINEAKSRSIKKIFSNNLQLQHEMSAIKRCNKEEDMLKLNDPLTIINLFDKEKTLIGFYEFCLTKKINADNAAKRITSFSILNDDDNKSDEIKLAADATMKSIEKINKETRRQSQSVKNLPVLSDIMPKTKKNNNEISTAGGDEKNSDLLENSSDFEQLARRISLIKHPQYMLSITKGATKKHKSIQDTPKIYRVAKERYLIRRMSTKEKDLF
jgi:hypothetical protein